jgi:PII-like signaling protein
MTADQSHGHVVLHGTRTLMRIHVGEADRWEGVLLYEAIVDTLRRRGLAGATVTQCIMGFGARGDIHAWESEVASLDMPVVVECVDDEARIQAVLPELDRMIGGGLITLERAEVIAYRPGTARETNRGG